MNYSYKLKNLVKLLLVSIILVVFFQIKLISTVDAQVNDACSADLNNDGKVDIFDYSILSANFFETGDNVADINGDQKVNIFDYSILSANFFGTCLVSDAITVSIDPNTLETTSSLNVGVTHTQESADRSGDDAAIANAKSLLESGVSFQNQHIHGFGASNLWDDPSTDVADWNWSSLDTRVRLMRDTNSTPVLTLCCAPTWMVDADWYSGKYGGRNTDWSLIEEAPIDIHEEKFAFMIQEITKRYDGVNLDKNGTPYPKITHFQVWNEMKGFWDRSNNTWNDEKYNRMYSLIYEQITSVRPEAKIGGPYVRFSKYLYPSSRKISNVTDESYGTVDQRDLNVVTSWLTWLKNNPNSDGTLKASFITVDTNLNSKDVTDGTFPPNIFAATKLYSDLNIWMTAEMNSVIGKALPIWWAEDYVGKTNGDPVVITEEYLQSAALATMLQRHVLSESSISLRWGPEEQIDSSDNARGNRQNLYSSTRFPGGGQPYDNYDVYSYFNEHFSVGTDIYKVTISPSSENVSVLASSSKVLLINQSEEDINFIVNESTFSENYSVSAYSVLLVDVPN